MYGGDQNWFAQSIVLGSPYSSKEKERKGRNKRKKREARLKISR